MYMAYLLITIILPVLKQNLSNTHVFWTSFLFQTKNYLNITSNITTKQTKTLKFTMKLNFFKF